MLLLIKTLINVNLLNTKIDALYSFLIFGHDKVWSRHHPCHGNFHDQGPHARITWYRLDKRICFPEFNFPAQHERSTMHQVFCSQPVPYACEFSNWVVLHFHINANIIRAFKQPVLGCQIHVSNQTHNLKVDNIQKRECDLHLYDHLIHAKKKNK